MPQTDKACEDIYAKLTKAGREILYDDTQERPGAKFAGMDLIGIPTQLIVGPRGLEKGLIEIKNRADGRARGIVDRGSDQSVCRMNLRRFFPHPHAGEETGI